MRLRSKASSRGSNTRSKQRGHSKALEPRTHCQRQVPSNSHQKVTNDAGGCREGGVGQGWV